MQNTTSSKQFFEKAKTCIPGGVNSPVRAFNSVGGIPRFIRSAKGPFLYDVDGNEYVDTICSWGPAIVGHANETVISAIRESMNLGLSFGAPTEGETRLAEIIKKHLPPRCVPPHSRYGIFKSFSLRVYPYNVITCPTFGRIPLGTATFCY